MGKYKFRFSDMIPSKLKDMSSSSSSKPRSNKHQSLPHSKINSDHRKSYYFSRDLSPHPDSPTTKRNRPRPRPPPPQFESDSVSPPSPEESGPDQSSSSGRGSAADSMVSWSNHCKCGNKNDIIIDIAAGDDHCRRLKPIITKKDEIRTSAPSIKAVKEETTKKVPAKSPGMRLRVNSPRIANRRIQGRKSVSRRSISDSFAVVKASRDPRRDFRESMVEMIMENNIKTSKDLEELLACYLTLNSEEYHDLIINVFKQIWFDFIHLRLN